MQRVLMNRSSRTFSSCEKVRRGRKKRRGKRRRGKRRRRRKRWGGWRLGARTSRTRFCHTAARRKKQAQDM
jgi:hypothetical protein